jgi:two-component system, NarL family, nitrate/nitrite response regulator NarL
MTGTGRARDDAAVTRTIVIVDDHPGFREFARRLLEAGGLLGVVGEAADGASGVALVERLAPDAVLLDIQLPDMDGFEVARRLASDGSLARVVLTSTRGREDYGDSMGATAFVPKDDLSASAVLEAMGAA